MIACFASACNEGVSVEPIADSGASDAAVEDAAWIHDAGIVRCGEGPWVTYSRNMYREWDRAPWPGIVTSVDLCPELTALSDENGYVAFAITRGRPFSILSEHPDLGRVAMHQRNALWSFHEDLYSERVDPTVSPKDPSMAFITVMPIAVSMASAPCNSVIGLTVSAKEYPTATVRYLIEGAEVAPDDPREPQIMIEGLPDAVDVTVEATKAGCDTRVNWYPNDTGKVRTHLGYNTQANVLILPRGDAG